MKTCYTCKVEKELTEYHKNKRMKDGLSGRCKNCCRDAKVLPNGTYWKEKLKEKGNKYCPVCYTVKSMDDFGNVKSNKDGRCGLCKGCKSESDKTYRQKLRDNGTYAKTKRAEYERNYEQYLKTQKLWRENNKELKAERDRDYNRNNKEKIAEQSKKHYQENKEEINKKTKKYAQANREHINKRARNRRETDPLFKLTGNIRSLIGKAIREGGYSKKTKTAQILGCDFELFMKHIERQFEPWMTWDNRGEWHLDHIYPVSKAKNEEDLIKLNHYTNFRPLRATDNIIKGAKIVEHQTKLTI